VSILYISMYGHTVKALKRLEEDLSSRGLNVKAIDAAEVHISDVLGEANNSAGLIVMFPTYDASIPMPLYEALYAFQVKMFGRGRPAGAESFFTLIEAFLISVYSRSLLGEDDLPRRCELCPKGWGRLRRCEPRAVGLEGVP